MAQDHRCAIDSLPLPVLAFHLVPSAAGTSGGRAAGADFGKVPTKKQTRFGDKLHLLVTLGGVIRDFTLAPASASDVAVGGDLLREHVGLTVLGDKGYISAPLATELRAERGTALLTVPRRNQRRQLPDPVARRLNAARQIIETVNDQLTAQFGLALHHAHTFHGLCARLYTKLAAHTLCRYLNRLLGHADFRQIKDLAFPTNYRLPDKDLEYTDVFVPAMLRIALQIIFRTSIAQGPISAGRGDTVFRIRRVWKPIVRFGGTAQRSCLSV